MADSNREWSEIDTKEKFFALLNRYTSPQGRERAANLLAEYEKWHNRGFSEKDAIRKAFASIDTDMSDKRIEDLERLKLQYSEMLKQFKKAGYSEKDIMRMAMKQTGIRLPEETKIDDAIEHWKKVKGHAMSQHQDIRRFVRWGRGSNYTEQGTAQPQPQTQPQSQPLPPTPTPDDEDALLRIVSSPFHGVKVKIKKQDKDGNLIDIGEKPTTISIKDKIRSFYLIEVPEEATEERTGIKYKFSKWEDGSTDPKRDVLFTKTLTGTITIVATYEVLKLVVDSRPIRQVPVYIEKVVKVGTSDVTANGETPFEFPVEENKSYIVKVPLSFEDTSGVYSFESWEDGEKKEKRNVEIKKESVYVTALYKRVSFERKYTERARAGSAYSYGKYAPRGEAPGGVLGWPNKGQNIAGDMAGRKLNRSFFQKDGIKRELEYAKIGSRSPYKNPAVRAAINKGKRMINAYARAEYTKQFKPIKQKFEEKRKEMKDDIKKMKDVRKSIRRQAKGYKGKSGIQKFMDTTSAGASDYEHIALAQKYGIAQDDVKLLQDMLEKRDKYFKDLDTNLESAAAAMEKNITDKSNMIATQLARRYRFPLNSEDEDALRAELNSYAQYITEQFIARGRSFGHALHRGIANLSRSMATVGDVWSNILGNLWNFFTGPWIIGTLFVVLQWFFTITWIGYNPWLAFWFPVLGAVIVWVINFESAKTPLDWIGHMASGAMLSYTVIIFFYALGITMESMGMMWFVVAGGAVFLLIGVFQVYQIGGFRSILMLAIIIMLFGYIALGPYSGYWQVIKDQIGTPLRIAVRAIERAAGDAWLLATNPTEWYARQQIINSKPEKPIDFPKGIEISLFDAMPSTVPANTQFAVTAVFKNEGENTAKDIRVAVSCNQWCDPSQAMTSSNFQKIGFEDKMYFKYNGTDAFEKNTADSITISGIEGKTVGGREGEFRMAKVKMEVIYKYYTSASLPVEVMSEDEMNRLFREGKDVFRPVLATEKVTPAKLSLNVGPQPLKSNTNDALLLISVSNTRDDGEITLRQGTKIRITMPKSIGSELRCGNYVAEAKEGSNNLVLEYVIDTNKPLVIKAYDFSSIFAILCSFRVADLTKTGEPTISGFITAELGDADTPGYEFSVYKEKDVPITTPLGILYDPFQSICDKCGKGFTNIVCDQTECEKLKDEKGNKCWFRSNPGPDIVVGAKCYSCGLNQDCGQFTTSETECNYGADICHFSCVWHPLKEGEHIPVSAGGAQVEIAKGWCEKKPVAYNSCSGTITSAGQLRGTALANCADYFDMFYNHWSSSGLKDNGIDLLMLLTIAEGESSCKMAQNSGGHGIMQIVKGTAESECADIGTFEQISYEPDKNIYCGVRVLNDVVNSLRSKGAEDDNLITLALFSYNRGIGTAYRAIELMNSGKDLVTAMRDACYEYYDREAYGGCGGHDKESCCFGEGFGARYPEKYIQHYMETCQKLGGEVTTTPGAGNTLGSENFCENQKNNNGIGCLIGQGNCNSNSECCQPGVSGCWVPSGTSSVVCKNTGKSGIDLCCSNIQSDEDCNKCYETEQNGQHCV
jgi:hypothetical protein